MTFINEYTYYGPKGNLIGESEFDTALYNKAGTVFKNEIEIKSPEEASLGEAFSLRVLSLSS